MNDCVLEYSRTGLDHGEIVGVADSRAMPSGCSYSRPQTLGKSVYSPEYCNAQQARQAREILTKIGMEVQVGSDMSVEILHNRLEGEPWAKRASGGGKRERL